MEGLVKCSPATLAYYAAYRASHRDEHAAYAATYRDVHREETGERERKRQRWFLGNLRILKQTQGCADCGTSEGRLDHHHVDPATKNYSVSQMSHCSLEKFIDEIAKCTVLCLPCHNRSHAT